MLNADEQFTMPIKFVTNQLQLSYGVLLIIKIRQMIKGSTHATVSKTQTFPNELFDSVISLLYYPVLGFTE